jgi:putative ABC transport system permease protein
VKRTATILTRVLLLLYPPSFRKDVGNALVGDVRQRAEDLASSRMGVRAGFWLIRLTTSLLANAFAAWVEKLIPSIFSLSWLDLKLALRMLVKYPGLTLTGGLGIAVAVAIGVGFFAYADSRFYPTIPLSEGDRLVALENWDQRTTREERRSLHDFVLWRETMKSVEDLAAFRTVARNVIATDGSVELVQVAEITPSGFPLARVAPLLGRSLLEVDAAPGAAPVIVIGFNVWRARFASAPDIVGRDLRLGSTVHTVVGVMPEGFAFPVNHRFWTPLKTDLPEYKRGEGPSIFISGRLAPGLDLADANAELAVIGDRMAAEFPDTHKFLRPEVLPYTYQFAGMSRSSSDDFWAMSGLASLLLVVVCVNVAILIYARTATRLGEIAVRSALGASRGRIVAQLFAESLVLSSGGAAVGLVVVTLALDWARSTMAGAGQSTFWADYTLSGTALVYVVALTVLASVITGVIPALQATGRRVQFNLCHFHSGSGLRLGRTWTTLIVVQVSVACAAIPIAVGLGLFQVRDFFRVPSFPVEQILFARVGLEREPPVLPAHFANLQTELSRRLEAEPGVVGHAFTLDLPGVGISGRVAIENDATASATGAIREVLRSTVDLNFFRTFDVDLLAGRPFDAGDRGESPADVIIVNRAFARRVLGDRDALGRRIGYVAENPRDSERLRPERGAKSPSERERGWGPASIDNEPGRERWYEIVGVVENIDANPFGQDLVDPRVYHPMKNVEGSRVGLALRVAGIEHGSLARRLGQIAAEVDPTLEVDVVPLAEYYRVLRAALSTAAAAIGVGVLSVLLLSAAGVYALMSFTVAQRRREIAIRIALGAQPSRLLRGIFGRGLRQVSLGVALGVGMALLVDGTSQGEALRGNGGLLLSGMVIVMSLVGLFAAVGPARRGLQIEPSEALKGE